MNKVIEKHPNPQFAREKIYLLNGDWEISLNGERMRKIRVPYCPESELSGIGYTDFIRECEYRKVFELPEEMNGGRVLLRFGAVNYFARVYVNGKCAGSHAGGYTPFFFDVTEMLKPGENLIDVCVRNELSERNPSGKQSPKRESFGCFYTRCTGIWQSVWLESVPEKYIRSVRMVPNAEQGCIRMEVAAEGAEELSAEISIGGKTAGACGGRLNWKGSFTVPLSEKRLWEIGRGELYEVKMRFGEDEVYTYFGLRDVKYEGYRFLVNRDIIRKAYIRPTVRRNSPQISNGRKIWDSTARACIKKFSIRGICTKAISEVLWCGANMRAGASIIRTLQNSDNLSTNGERRSNGI